MTTLDLLAAYGTGNSAALDTAGWRAVLAMVAWLAGQIAGAERGWMSRLTMAGTLGLSAVQCGSLLGFLDQVLDHPGQLFGLLPNAVTQSLSLLTALRTAWIARG